MSLRAGQMRSRVTILSPLRISDGQGGYTTQWSTYRQVWAEKRHLSGGEVVEAEQVVSRRVPSFKIRRASDIAVTQAMRVADGDQVYAITSVAKDDFDRSMTVLTCEEVLNEQ